jgi:hypothetical protein
MNKRSWWKAAAAVVVGGAGIALADSPKVEQAVWTRASAPVAAPTVAPATAVVPAAKPELKPATPSIPSYPLPPKSSSDSVVMPEFRAAPQAPAPVASLPPISTAPVASLPPIVTPPTTSNKIPVVDPPKVEKPPAIVVPPVKGPAPAAVPAIPPASALPMLPTPVKEPAPAAVPAIPPASALPMLPPPPEIAPPAQPAKSADSVKPLPPAIPDFNLRPAPGGNSVNSNGPPAPSLPAIPPATPEPSNKMFARPAVADTPPTDKYVFPIPEKIPVAVKPQPAIPATLPTGDMPETLSVPTRLLPGAMPPVPMVLPGVPTSIERPVPPPKPELNTIPTPGADPMNLKQTTMAAALGTALALSPLTASAQPGGTKTTDEKLVEAQKEIKRLAELLDGRKDTDGKASPVDVGAVEEIKRLKDDVFRLKEKVLTLQNQLDELKKSTTSLKPAPVDPMAGKGTVRVENDYAIEITIVVNTMSYRVPANTKLDIPVPAGDFTYQLLNSGTGLAPVKSPIKEKEVVKLRIK